MKDGLGGKIVAKSVALRPKTYGYLTDDRDENEKVRGTKNLWQNKNSNSEIIKIASGPILESKDMYAIF